MNNWQELMFPLSVCMERVTALRKHDGGGLRDRGRRHHEKVCGRTIAEQINSNVGRSTAPLHDAMTTCAGTECAAHALQALTEINPEATVMSLDGISAFDLFSRKSMLEALCRMPGVAFVRMFIGALVARRFRGRAQHSSMRRRQPGGSSHAYSVLVWPAWCVVPFRG